MRNTITTKRWLFALMLPLAGLTSWAIQALDNAPEDAVITNQAIAEYFDEARGVGARALSNIAKIPVAKVYDLELVTDQQIHAAPGQYVNFPHILTNTGNTADHYELATANIADDAFDLQGLGVYQDVNNNGVVDPGEPELSDKLVYLHPGDFVHLVVAGQLPTTLPAGEVARVTVSAFGQGNPEKVRVNSDRVDTSKGELILQKSATPLCSSPVVAGDTIEYTLVLTNTGQQTPPARALTVDGEPVTGMLLEDPLPANTYLAADVPMVVAPESAIALVKRQADAADVWTTVDAWNGSDLIEAVGVLFDPNSVGSNYTVLFEFGVIVGDLITPGTLIENTASINLDGIGAAEVVSNEVCNTLAPTSPAGSAQLSFKLPNTDLRQACSTAPDTCIQPNQKRLDDFEDTGLYRLDEFPGYNVSTDGIYLEVRSSSLNTSPVDEDVQRADGGFPREITVQVRSRLTGDLVRVVVRETGPNTGLFRSISPLRLSGSQLGGDALCPGKPELTFDTAADPACVLRSGPNDELIATIRDGDRNRTVLTDQAVVDPTGVVFNSVNRVPVPGATVTILDSNGQPARDPDTGGATAIAPQVTGTDGRYQFPRVFPGDYFINIDPPNGFEFPSQVPEDSFVGLFEVGQFSYGKDGFSGIPNSGVFTLNAGDPIKVIDVPLDPFNSIGQFSITKEASIDLASVGDFVPYTVTVQNLSGAVLVDAKVNDRLPHGFKYVPGSAKLDGNRLADPQGDRGPDLVFDIGRLNIGQQFALTYVTELGAGALDSDGINIAQAQAITGGNLPLFSPTVRARVRVQQDPLFSDNAYVFGKVYVESDCDGEQSEREWPIGGVRLYMEDGTWVITDENGQYSLYGIRPGQHIVKLDNTTMPVKLDLKPLDNRHGAEPDSRFVDLQASEWHRADFAVYCPCSRWIEVVEELKARNEDINGDWLLDQMQRYRDPSQNALNQGLRQRDQRAQAGPDGDLGSATIYGPNAGSTTARQPSANVRDLTKPRQDKLKTDLAYDAAKDDPVFPKPEEIAKTVTKAQAKAGTWLWPVGEYSRDGRFVIVIRAGLKPTLYVDGVAIGHDKLGEQIGNRRNKAEVLGFYGIEMEPGEHLIEVKAKDPFGNERTLASRKVIRPGGAVKLLLEPASPRMNADGGVSAMAIKVRMEDENGHPAHGLHYVTMEYEDGRWIEQDVQSSQPGHQVRIEHGEATIHLRSSYQAGKVRLRATADATLSDEASIEFVEPMRPLIAAGIIDASIGQRSYSFSEDAPTNLDENPEDEFDVDGRAAVFVKGHVKGDVLLTLSYDTDKKDDNVPAFRDIDPLSHYPTYGDASVKGYDAQSRSRLYAKVERGQKSILWGDYLTDPHTDLEAGASLGRQQETLTGLNARWEEGDLALSGYAAERSSNQVIRELRGNGTATDYRVDVVPMVRNTEVIEIIIRDRENSGLTVSNERLSRFGDYNIDPERGFITFHDAIPSEDENGNPVFIRITYDTEGNGEDHVIAGLRGAYQVGENTRLEASYSHNGANDEGYDLASAALVYKPGQGQVLVVEAAAMDFKDGARQDGSAARIKYEGRIGDKLRIGANAGFAEEGFQNPHSPINRGRGEAQVDIAYRLDAKTELKGEALHSRASGGGERRTSVGVGVSRRLGAWRVEGGTRYVTQDNAGDSDDFYTGRVRVERGFKLDERDGNIFVEYEQDVGNAERKSFQLGTDYQIHDRVKGYGRYEHSSSLAGGASNFSSTQDRDSFVFGLETDALPSTRMYSELRQRGLIDGRELATANGIRSSFQLTDGLTLSPQAEWIRTMSGDNQGNATAVSIGLTDARHANVKQTMRAEGRWNRDGDYYGFTGARAARLNLAWSSLIREDFSLDLPDDADRRLRHTLTVGVAHRPRLTNRHHFLGLYRWREERNQDLEARTAHIVSGHHNYQANADLRLSGHAAAKWQKARDGGTTFDSTVQLLGGRVLWDINRRWDLDLHVGGLSTDWGKSRRYAAGIGANFLVGKGWRVGAGYNFRGFDDADLDTQKWYRRGFYISTQFKFDETDLGWLKPEGAYDDK